MGKSVILSPVRTPMGKFLDDLLPLAATELGAIVVRAAACPRSVFPRRAFKGEAEMQPTV